jgi:hypothetical protein
MRILNSSIKEKNHPVGGLTFFNSFKGENNLKGDSNPPLGLSRSAFYPHELLRHNKYTKLILDKKAAANSTYKKLAVHWLNEALCFVSISVLTHSSVLRNRQLLVAAKRYALL